MTFIVQNLPVRNSPIRTRMRRIRAFLIAAMFVPMSATALSPGGTPAPDVESTTWLDIAMMGNTAGSVAAPYYSGRAGHEPKVIEQTVTYWIFPQPEFMAESIWPRIREGFAIPEVEGRRVAQFERWYQKNPEYVGRMLARASLFLHYIVEEIEKRDMPMELALLPMIESAYNPTAYSRAHASGIWQFIPSTGKRYGLEQNWWLDERRDVIAATKAALDYLEMLHAEFNDWHLALAAYNYGENGVRRAIKRNKKRGKSTDYYHLRMPRETRNYLPKLQAVKNIISDPEQLNLALPEVADRPYFTIVEARQHIDIEVAARLAEMSIEDFEVLNAAYNRPVIASDGGRKILLPLDKAEAFITNLEYHDEPLVSWQTYALKKNESVEKVAARFNMDVDKLRQINGIKPYVKLRHGHSLLVPMPDHADESNLDETWNRPEFSRPNNFYGTRIVHRIRRGDTLSTIAQRYGVSVRGIKSWNGIRGSLIRAGDRLVIYKDLRVPRVSTMLQ
jgi:membrane-bound lytic murein transglycosylase D